MNLAAVFAARPLLLLPSALPEIRAVLEAASAAPGGLRAGPEPGPAPEPRSLVTGQPWPGYRVREDGIAEIRVHGPIVHRDTPINNILTGILGGTVLDHVHRAVEDARTDRAVKGVLLDVDSPGGEAGGIDEVAAAVHDLDGRKPVVAYVADLGASAAYWLSAATGQIIGNPASLTGSIGVAADFLDDTEMLAKAGVTVHAYTSTQSPRKRPQPGTAEGDAQIQEWLDSLADQFLARVAAYRGTTPLRVMEDFGQGDVLIASEAVKVGLIDRIGTKADALKALHLRIKGTGKPRSRATVSPAARTGHVARLAGASGRPVARLGDPLRCRASSSPRSTTARPASCPPTEPR